MQLNPPAGILWPTLGQEDRNAPASTVAVRLTDAQREALDRVVRTSPRLAAILLRANTAGRDAWTDDEIADHLETSRMTVQRVRQQFAAEGLDATRHRKKPTGRPYCKLDGEQEARPVAPACSAAPEGRARWTMKLLADKLVEREVLDAIDPATVCRTLQKTTSSRGSSNSGSSRPRRRGRSSRRWRT